MFKHFELLVLCFSTGLMVTLSPNVFGFICLLRLLNVTKVPVGRAGVAGNIVRPARLSDRTILPRLNRPVGYLTLGGIVRVQAIWSGLLSQNVR
jgi:hypothetical protein